MKDKEGMAQYKDTHLQKWLAFSIPLLKQQGMMMLLFGGEKPKRHFPPKLQQTKASTEGTTL